MGPYTSKNIYTETHFDKEFSTFPKDIQDEIHKLFSELKKYGYLQPPDAKKLANTDLFEVRINKNGAWRCIYAYKDDYIVLLTAFQKKTMKTPLKEIHTSLQRLNNLSNK